MEEERARQEAAQKRAAEEAAAAAPVAAATTEPATPAATAVRVCVFRVAGVQIPILILSLLVVVSLASGGSHARAEAAIGRSCRDGCASSRTCGSTSACVHVAVHGPDVCELAPVGAPGRRPERPQDPSCDGADEQEERREQRRGRREEGRRVGPDYPPLLKSGHWGGSQAIERQEVWLARERKSDSQSDDAPVNANGNHLTVAISVVSRPTCSIRKTPQEKRRAHLGQGPP